VSGFPILTFITLLPLIAGIVVAGMGEQKKLARGIAFGTSLLSLALALVLWRSFDASSGALQFVEKHQ
jgi:NADH-quinone oxidoreductase subunit M